MQKNIDIKITENRAPTDESVKLLAEFEKAARDKIIKSFNIVDNNFNCVILKEESSIDDTITLHAIVSLNKTIYKTKFTTSLYDCTDKSLVIGIRNAIAMELADNCLQEIIESIRL